MRKLTARPGLTMVLALALLLGAGCAASAPQPSATAPLPPPTEAVEPTLPPTATPVPAEPTSPPPTEAPTLAPTETPTETPLPPTATPLPELAAEGVQGWCLPEDATLAMTSDPLNPPASARLGQMGAAGLEIRNLPAFACVFTYTFNQTPPEGLALQVYEARGQKPWLTAELKPVEGSPNAVSATLRHTYIIAPPLWDVAYQFALVDASGKELRRDPVSLHRWTPELCWNGRKPNPLTLRCPLQQDLHPWDAGYGTPMPTAVPREDD